MADPARNEHPPELRILLPARFFVTQLPLGRLLVNAPNGEFSSDNGEQRGGEDLHRQAR
jgi:hypothetical protein